MKPMILLGIATVCACAESQNYVYTPETANEMTAANLPAARTPIPQEQPQGAVEVASYGITHLNQGGASVPALHVRMVVTNDGDDSPWLVDTREQYVEIAGEGRSRAMFANSDVQSLPIVQVARHERHVFDLYFPLPDGIASESHLPRFDVQWQVTTPARVVASRTVFDRVTQEQPDYAYGTAYDGMWPYWAGYGPYWWYDPFYPTVVFNDFHAGHFHGFHDGRAHVEGFHGHFAPGGGVVAHGGHVGGGHMGGGHMGGGHGGGHR